METDKKSTLKNAFETLLIAICCFAFVSSMHNSCSGNKTHAEKNVQKKEQITNINSFVNQKVR